MILLLLLFGFWIDPSLLILELMMEANLLQFLLQILMFSSANIFVISEMASEREAKQLEAATEALGGRVADVKSSLGQLIRKMETDPTLNWHSFLDSYALISGQMNSLLKQMRHEKTPLLRKYITLPLLLSPDR